jgi:hypothetical protein
MLSKALKVSTIALALGGLLAAVAAADTLTLRDKKQITGDVIEVTDKAVRIRTADNTLALVGFERLAPASLYELLRARVDEKDAAARLALADTCKRWKAYDGARSELDAAVKIDAKLAKTAAAKRKSVNEAQAGELWDQALELMLTKKHTEALAIFRTIADRFAETSFAEKALAKSVEAVKGLEKADAAVDAKKAKPRKKKLTTAEKRAAKKAKQIAFATTQADKNAKLAEAQNREGLKADGIGQVSKAKRAYEAALTYDLRAKEFLGKTKGVQRVATDLATLEKAQKQIEKLNKHIVAVHLSLSALHMKQRNFKRARTHVHTALQLDPMNKRALEMREEIAKHSIQRKASELTNAKGRVTSGR